MARVINKTCTLTDGTFSKSIIFWTNFSFATSAARSISRLPASVTDVINSAFDIDFSNSCPVSLNIRVQLWTELNFVGTRW